MMLERVARLRPRRIRAGDPVLVGHDFRASSPGIAATCIGALKREGLTPLACGAVATPALALYGRTLVQASLVTGSHIPADRNGIYRPDGEIGKQDEMHITAIAAELEVDCFPAEAPDHSTEIEALFLKRNAIVLPPGALGGLIVGLYQHSTVARGLLGKVLKTYGGEVVALGRSDCFIPVDTEAVSSRRSSATLMLLAGARGALRCHPGEAAAFRGRCRLSVALRGGGQARDVPGEASGGKMATVSR